MTAAPTVHRHPQRAGNLLPCLKIFHGVRLRGPDVEVHLDEERSVLVLRICGRGTFSNGTLVSVCTWRVQNVLTLTGSILTASGAESSKEAEAARQLELAAISVQR